MPRRGAVREEVLLAEPDDRRAFTDRFDRVYTRYAGLYDLAARWIPLWGRWLGQVLPYIQGPRVLEVSFGTGQLLTRYAGEFETHAIDYNARMARVAQKNLRKAGLGAELVQADVQALPYRDGTFDSVVNTMSVSAYPDAPRALREMARVLRPGGRLVILDVGYPADRHWLGMLAVRLWVALGDIIWDVGAMLDECGFEYAQREAGALGSIQLTVAEKLGPCPQPHEPRGVSAT